jgi:hypothetical protein
MSLVAKQPVLKPQDILVVLAYALHADRRVGFADLASILAISASEAHAGTERAMLARLVAREEGRFVAVRPSVREFFVHGLKYAFPPLLGAVTRGVPTGSGAPPLAKYFGELRDTAPVWPDSNGTARGPSIQPLYPSVPTAARNDERLYEALTLIDAIRAGTARERVLATEELEARLP